MANIIKDFCKKFGYVSSLNIPDGNYKLNDDTVLFIKNGMLHREDGPSFISMSKGKYREHYYLCNILHRSNGPAVFESDGFYRKNKWYRYGRLHRDNEPAIEEIFENETKLIWYQSGKIHRVDEPAWIETLGKNTIVEKWYSNDYCYRKLTPFSEKTDKIIIKKYTNKDGNLHHKKYPSYYEKYGDNIKEQWYKNGKLHRYFAPASIEINKKYVKYVWYEDGIKYNERKVKKLFDDSYYLFNEHNGIMI